MKIFRYSGKLDMDTRAPGPCGPSSSRMTVSLPGVSPCRDHRSVKSACRYALPGARILDSRQRGTLRRRVDHQGDRHVLHQVGGDGEGVEDLVKAEPPGEGSGRFMAYTTPPTV